MFAVVDAAFAQRRKTLRSALAGWAGIAGGRRGGAARGRASTRGARARQLGVADFARIAEHRRPATTSRRRHDGPAITPVPTTSPVTVRAPAKINL